MQVSGKAQFESCTEHRHCSASAHSMQQPVCEVMFPATLLFETLVHST